MSYSNDNDSDYDYQTENERLRSENQALRDKMRSGRALTQAEEESFEDRFRAATTQDEVLAIQRERDAIRGVDSIVVQ